MKNISLPEVRGEYRFNFNLKPTTWFKVGGNAEVYFKPEDIDDLSYFLKNIEKSVPINILGNSSNIIIRDGGVEGVVIKLGRNFANLEIKDDQIIVGAGALNSSVANFAMQNGLGDLEFLIGIPGTIGGGIRMNAGAYGTEFKDVLVSFKAIDFNGEIKEFDSSIDLFKYRGCNLQDNLIFIEARFKTKKESPEIIKEKMNQINEQRSNSQPIKEKTGGSTFANPEGFKAWELIDKAGLRGYRIGDAIFSEKHCNFMINTGEARASDLEELGEFAIKKVKDLTGIELKWEIKRIGKNG
jgi:UDP-N-acetylmuramate dehydrogenase